MLAGADGASGASLCAVGAASCAAAGVRLLMPNPSKPAMADRRNILLDIDSLPGVWPDIGSLRCNAQIGPFPVAIGAVLPPGLTRNGP